VSCEPPYTEWRTATPRSEGGITRGPLGQARFSRRRAGRHDFDQEYLQAQIAGHLAALADFRAEADNGTDARVKALAQHWLPTIQSHLELAVSLTSHVGGASPFKSH
jgi:hypothetical protein